MAELGRRAGARHGAPYRRSEGGIVEVNFGAYYLDQAENPQTCLDVTDQLRREGEARRAYLRAYASETAREAYRRAFVPTIAGAVLLFIGWLIPAPLPFPAPAEATPTTRFVNPISFHNAILPVRVTIIGRLLCRSHRDRFAPDHSGLPFCHLMGQTRIIPN